MCCLEPLLLCCLKLKKFQTTQQPAIYPTNRKQNSHILVTEWSLPMVVQSNNSLQYRNEQNPTAVLFNSLIQTQEKIDLNCFPSNTYLTSLVPPSLVVQHHKPFTSLKLRKIHLHTTKQPSFLRLLNKLANQTFIKTRISFRIGPVTETISFIHALKYKQKDSRLNTI